MTDQLALEFAAERLHGCIVIYFSNGQRIRATVMASDKLWYDGEGDSCTSAVESAIRASNDGTMAKAWRELVEQPGPK